MLSSNVVPEPGLASMVWQAISRWPEEIAVHDGERKLTYRALAAESCSLMALLHERGVGKRDLVAVRLDRGISQIAALVAILGLGACYVPLSTNASDSGQRQILDASKPVVGIGEGIASADWISGDSVDGKHSGLCGICRPGKAADGDFSYLYFTSGSTGDPKGVLTGTACASLRIRNAIKHFDLGPGVCVVNKTPLIFDVSILEIFAALAAGAMLRVVPKGGEVDASLLSEVIGNLDSERVLIHFVPTAFRLFQGTIGESKLYSQITDVLTTGEGVDALTLKKIRATFPRAAYVNMYGQTETSEITYWDMPAVDNQEIPIVVPAGKTLNGYNIFVVDEQLKVLPEGEVGMIYVAGEEALADQYFKDASTTSISFTANPYGEPGSRWYRTGDLGRYSGDSLEVLGRANGYIKVNGIRADLPGIENMIRRLPGITGAAVLVDDRDLLAHICLFYTGSPDIETVRKYCSDSLLPDLIPAHIAQLDKLPQTESGKTSKECIRKIYLEGNKNEQFH